MKATFDGGWYYAGWQRDIKTKTIDKITIYDMKTGEKLFELEENKDENNISE